MLFLVLYMPEVLNYLSIFSFFPSFLTLGFPKDSFSGELCVMQDLGCNL